LERETESLKGLWVISLDHRKLKQVAKGIPAKEMRWDWLG